MLEDFWLYLAIGFLAQIVDGALGMAYGVTATTFLLSLDMPPALASASVHASEIFTSGVSGFSHLCFRNIDWSIFRKLVIPGAAGAVLGAGLVTVLPVAPVRAVVSLYLAVMGIIILRNAFAGKTRAGSLPSRLSSLGLFGGFCDALGGGGWGPIVVSSLLGRGGNPRYTVGSVNLAEFFVTLAAATTFFLTIGLGYWRIIAGLVLGGIPAAPLAAYLCKKIPVRTFLILIGILVLLLSLRTLAQVLHLL
jgi:uncharacterized protein